MMTTHTDHPLRHYDRTCPACNEGASMIAYEGGNLEPLKIKTGEPTSAMIVKHGKLMIFNKDGTVEVKDLPNKEQA